MAEAFGIASGAIGITGIFKTCVECFEYIQIGRSFGQKFQTELLTLSLLKLRLSRWGEAVGVYDDPQLGHPEATKEELDLARETLYQILVVFSDSQKAANRFRLVAKPGEDLSTLTQTDIGDNLSATCNKMQKLAARRQKGASFGKLASWALYHRDHFSRLIQDITQLLDNLEQAFPAPAAQTSLAKAEFDEISTGDEKARSSMLRMLQETPDQVDTAFKTVATGQWAMSIGTIEAFDDARVRNGTSYSKAWRGEAVLPQNSTSLCIGSIRAEGNARVMNGDSYNDEEDFWNN